MRLSCLYFSSILILTCLNSNVCYWCVMVYGDHRTRTDYISLDYETDTIIQTSLRRELSKDVSLLTVAHRLQTIMDADKIVSIFLIVWNDANSYFRACSDGPRRWQNCESILMCCCVEQFLICISFIGRVRQTKRIAEE